MRNSLRLTPIFQRPEFLIFIIVLILLAIRPYTRYTETMNDQASYITGANMLSSGSFYVESPPANFRVMHCVDREGRFYSRYFPGTLLLAAMGLKLLGTWYIGSVIMLGGVLILLAELGRRMGGFKILGWLPLSLVGIYLDLVAMVFTLHSIIYSTFFTLLFVWSLYRGLETGRKRWWVTAGLAIGYAAITRPMFPAILSLIAGIILLLFALTKGREWWLRFACFAAPLVLCASFQLWYNYRVTGDWLTLPFLQYDPHSGMGFGLKGDHFTGNYHMFTLIDVLRQMRGVIWGANALLLPILISITASAWAIVTLFNRRGEGEKSERALAITSLVMGLGTLCFIFAMCFHWAGMVHHHYFLEVNCFAIIFVAVAAGKFLKRNGKLGRRVVILAMLMFAPLSLFEAAYATYIGIKTTRPWKRIFRSIDDLSAGENTLFIIHPLDKNRYPGGRWALGNFTTQYLLNPPDLKAEHLFAVSLGDVDRALVEDYRDKYRIMHVTVDEKKGEVLLRK